MTIAVDLGRKATKQTKQKIKRGVKKEKYIIDFANTQLRIIRLRKYPIDPKAYLELCRSTKYQANINLRDETAFQHMTG